MLQIFLIQLIGEHLEMFPPFGRDTPHRILFVRITSYNYKVQRDSDDLHSHAELVESISIAFRVEGSTRENIGALVPRYWSHCEKMYLYYSRFQVQSTPYPRRHAVSF